MKSFRYTITDKTGIHARPAGLLVKEARKYKSRIRIKSGEKSVEATGLMAVMSLGIACGQTIEILVEGEDEQMAVAGMEQFFKRNL
nr:HPr family phosphocarrier protein [Lachnospiraceae bacterium]